MSAITDAASTITVGGVGIWTLVAMGLVGWWRGLPKFIPLIIEKVTERNSKLAEGFDRQIARLEAQLTASDERHETCLSRATAQEERIEHLEATNRALREDMDALRRQWVQQQASTIAVLPGSTVSKTIQDAAQRSVDSNPST